MQEMRIMTVFGNFRKTQMTVTQNKIICWFCLFPKAFIFHNFEFSEEIAKSKSRNLLSYFNTLIFKLSRLKKTFEVVFENFSADR